jgi:hypothetical protein
LSEREHELARVHHPRCGAAAWSMTTNLKTAKMLNLKLPPNLVALADEVID